MWLGALNTPHNCGFFHRWGIPYTLEGFRQNIPLSSFQTSLGCYHEHWSLIAGACVDDCFVLYHFSIKLVPATGLKILKHRRLQPGLLFWIFPEFRVLSPGSCLISGMPAHQQPYPHSKNKLKKNRAFRKMIMQNKHYFTTFLLTSELKCNFRVTSPAPNRDLLCLKRVADSRCFDGSGTTIHQQNCDLVTEPYLEVGLLHVTFRLICQPPSLVWED